MSIIKKHASVFLINSAALIIILAGVHAASYIVVRILLSLLIAFICSPIFFFLTKRGLPQWLSLTVVLLTIFVAGLLLAALIGSSINDFTAAWPIYQENFSNMITNITEFLHSHGFDVSASAVMSVFDPNMVVKLVGGMLSTFTGMMSDSIVIIFYVIFMLLEAYSVPLKSIIIWGEQGAVLREINKFTSGMQRYIVLKTLISLATGVLIGVALLLLKVDFALMWGMIAFLLNYIPTIGSIIASIPPILLSMFQMGWATCLAVTAVYLAVNNVIGNFLEPRIMGRGLDLSPLVVYASVIFWGWLLGPVGMLLSVPLTMSAKIYLERRDSTKWLATILAEAPPLKKQKEGKNGSTEFIEPRQSLK
ncbi:MAG: AI-2E family transporter [Calditrichaeota bacterium]|nr:MAG: AI-2E family transporter [Calditrichota bacterium]